MYSHVYHEKKIIHKPYATLLYFIYVHLTKEIQCLCMYVYHRLTHGVEKLAESDKLIIMYNVYVDSKKKEKKYMHGDFNGATRLEVTHANNSDHRRLK